MYKRQRLHYVRWFHEGFERYDLSTEMGWRQMRAAYWGLCSLVDTHIGTILDTLAECGLFDDTIIVFTSDHGDMMGSHRLFGKGVMYQESVRVPLLIHLPGQMAPRHITGPFSQIDLVPTLLDLMGQPVPDGLHGASRADTVQQGGQFHDDVFIQWNSAAAPLRDYPGYMLDVAGSAERIYAVQHDDTRTIVTPDGWRFTYSPFGDHALFNLAMDREERHNLAQSPDHKMLIQALLARIAAWQERVFDSVALCDI